MGKNFLFTFLNKRKGRITNDIVLNVLPEPFFNCYNLETPTNLGPPGSRDPAPADPRSYGLNLKTAKNSGKE